MSTEVVQPEVLSEGVNMLLYIVSILLPVALPLVTKWIDNVGFIDKIPTNWVTAILAFIMIFPMKFVFAPELSFIQCVFLVGTLGLGGGTLMARTVPALRNKKPNTP